MKKTPEIILDEKNAETIANSIASLSNSARLLLSSGLNERALLVLLKDATGVAHREIKLILDTLPKLCELYCKTKGK